MNISKATEKRNYTLTKFIIANNDGEAEVFIRIFFNRNKAETKTDVKGLASDWNAKEYNFDASKPYNSYTNKKLKEIDEQVHYAYLKVKDSGTIITAQKIKQIYLGNNDAMDPEKPRLLPYFKSFIDRIEKLPDEYKPGTVQHYETTYGYLNTYLTKNSLENIRLQEFRRKHVMGFNDFLLTHIKNYEGKPIKQNTVNKYLSKLRKIYSHAEGEELVIIHPFKGYNIKRAKSRPKYLTMVELKKLMMHDLGGNESLNRIRWIFLFSVFTSLRYSDAIKLRRINIQVDDNGVHYITRLSQQKTGNPILVPMLNGAVSIFKMFCNKFPEAEYVLPRISNQKINTYLKIIADMVGINLTLTHHVARHTFATTIMTEAGIDIYTTKEFMGHESIKSTMQYSHVTESRLLDAVKTIDKRKVA